MKLNKSFKDSFVQEKEIYRDFNEYEKKVARFLESRSGDNYQS